jgi:zinc transport system permease protein
MSFFEILGYGFIQRALIAGTLIGLLCALLGIFLVLRRFSLIGDGLAHFTFGSVALVLLCGVSAAWVTYAAIPLVLVGALGILKLTASARIHGDTAIGIVSALGIALGVILSSLSGGYNVDLFSYLFGNILIITRNDVYLTVVLAVVVVMVVTLRARAFFAVAFDEELARTSGINTRTANILLVLMTAVTVVLAMKLVGIMLVSALLIIPPVAALQLRRGFMPTILFAAGFGILSVVSGILASFALNLPTGGTIIVASFLLFVVASLAGRFGRR